MKIAAVIALSPAILAGAAVARKDTFPFITATIVAQNSPMMKYISWMGTISAKTVSKRCS